MPGIAEIETASLATWPALETVVDGAWHARFSRGYSGRSNSIWVLDAADDADAGARLDRLVVAYRRRGLPPMLRLTALTPPGLVAMAQARGWTAYGHSIVMGSAAPVGRHGAGSDHVAVTDPGWLAAKTRLSGLSEDDRSTLAAVLPLMPSPAAGILHPGGGAPVGAALAVVSHGIGLYYNVVVDAAERGRGHGRALIGAALSWACAHGAGYHALQVAADNAAAIRLYERHGFSALYRYHYLRAPA